MWIPVSANDKSVKEKKKKKVKFELFTRLVLSHKALPLVLY